MHKKSWDEDDSQKEMIQNKIETYSPDGISPCICIGEKQSGCG